MNEKKILIVDDEKPIVDILKFNLEKEGFSTAVAYDGEEAINLALSIKPDLILLDLMLPKIDGFNVCRELRKNLVCPIIMLTAKEEVVENVERTPVIEGDKLTLRMESEDTVFTKK